MKCVPYLGCFGACPWIFLTALRRATECLGKVDDGGLPTYAPHRSTPTIALHVFTKSHKNLYVNEEVSRAELRVLRRFVGILWRTVRTDGIIIPVVVERCTGGKH